MKSTLLHFFVYVMSYEAHVWKQL